MQKEPVLCQLVKCRRRRGRAEEVAGEEAGRGLGGQRGCRQCARACDEFQTAHGGAHGEDPHRRDDALMARRPVGLCEMWHEGGGSWSGWQWDQPGDLVQTQRNLGTLGGETTPLGMEHAYVEAGLAAMG